ncbi:hypothetical protein GCM10022393_30660 [Aquimarina addita]|uniref:Deacylase n=1 Tax=Aquimarina addita TaxID=870485 RepID=A0ABP6UR70_9FLAO
MNNIFYLLLIFIGLNLNGQTANGHTKKTFFFIPEILTGKTMEANTLFPTSSLQKGVFLSIGTNNDSEDIAWMRYLGYPKTGATFGITDFGNTEKIGISYALMPFIEFGLSKKKTNRWNLQVGFGASYQDTLYDIETNPFNKAITTKFNWSYRSFLYYDFIARAKANWRLGLGYMHHSNGHTRLPNQGLNSLQVSVSSLINSKSEIKETQGYKKQSEKKRSSQRYFEVRTGIGQNVLSEVFNDKKEVYSVAASTGTIINKTFKFGGGIYYRFYEHYYDYIKNDGELVIEQVPFFQENPFRYATNYGLFGTAELLLGHIGLEFDIGLNISKPFYKIDWQLSQGFVYDDVYYLGELDWYYEVKRTISSRMGIKYYVTNTNKSPKNNFFISAHINANLGQADFSELSIGYVYRFNKKMRAQR